MNESVLKAILLQGTQLIKKVALKEITAVDFLKQYNNFYYYNALDGHEANDLTASLFKKYSSVISLHKDIQTNVVDAIYLGGADVSSKQLAVGRISVNDAIEKISTILKTYNIEVLLSMLEGTNRTP